MSSTSRTAYSYTVLRYVHDVATGEFLNVGVVIMSPGMGYVGAKFKTSYGRLKKAFPSLDGEAYRSRMRRLQAIFNEISEGSTAQTASTDDATTSIEHLVHSVLRRDDSALQWSTPGGGLAKDLPGTLNGLFERFVGKYDSDAIAVARKDDDVWRHFRAELDKRNVLGYLEEKVIAVADDSVKFGHAWKNGAWNCFEPLSFDLASDVSIKEKAHRWLGQVSSIRDARESFNVYFLVGRPADTELHEAYEQAISILRKAPSSEVIEESMAAQFSDRVAQQIAAHTTSSL